ncbi:hypothetical protein NQ176_g8345 [Zarea fungicola]|uniref:Uncharacterized protein n=1 Tax=Zarea fungicola TaxID=93591 RepID=A0ACC1MTV3_9HYPO|nr:hypothetical protein NQ176_g8345 [Lecanicillium fungicola]
MAAANKVYIAVIGAGGVGKAFLSQLQTLATRRPSPKLTLCYISTSRKALFNDDYSEISIDTALDSLAASTKTPPELSQVIEYLAAAPAKTILVDNTSSQDVADKYPLALSRGVSIVTPNKKAFSGPYKLWKDITIAATASGAKFDDPFLGPSTPIRADSRSGFPRVNSLGNMHSVDMGINLSGGSTAEHAHRTALLHTFNTAAGRPPSTNARISPFSQWGDSPGAGNRQQQHQQQMGMGVPPGLRSLETMPHSSSAGSLSQFSQFSHPSSIYQGTPGAAVPSYSIGGGGGGVGATYGGAYKDYHFQHQTPQLQQRQQQQQPSMQRPLQADNTASYDEAILRAASKLLDAQTSEPLAHINGLFQGLALDNASEETASKGVAGTVAVVDLGLLNGVDRELLDALLALGGDELSLTLVKHCDLATLECLRITCYGRRLGELQKPASGTRLNHLEVFYTASGIYQTWEDSYLPGLDVQSQEAICGIFPNLHTLSMTHVEESPLVFRPQDRVDYYEYPQKFVEMYDYRFDDIFSAIKVPSFPGLRRLALTIPEDIVEWFCQNCDCYGAENLSSEDKYGHVAQHIGTWGDNLRLVKLDIGNCEDAETYFPEQRDSSGRNMNRWEYHDGDTDAPISRFVMFKTI